VQCRNGFLHGRDSRRRVQSGLVPSQSAVRPREEAQALRAGRTCMCVCVCVCVCVSAEKDALSARVGGVCLSSTSDTLLCHTVCVVCVCVCTYAQATAKTRQATDFLTNSATGRPSTWPQGTPRVTPAPPPPPPSPPPSPSCPPCPTPPCTGTSFIGTSSRSGLPLSFTTGLPSTAPSPSM
jgi:hypothetical protein